MAFGVRGGAVLARRYDSANTDIGADGDSPELDCVRHLLDPDVLAAAEARAAAIGVGADRVLINARALSEETYLRALGAALGVAFETLDGAPRAQCPIDSDRLIEAAVAGLLPFMTEGQVSVVVAPRGARHIAGLIKANPALARRFRFTTAARLHRFVLRCSGKALAARASERLGQKWPEMSAAPPRWRGHVGPISTLGLLSLALGILAPTAAMLAFEIMLAAVFLAWLGLRLLGVVAGVTTRGPTTRLTDAALPVYTVMSALYREAASVNGLLAAIERLESST